MIERAFKKSEINVDLRSARDGIEALDLLRGEGAEAPLESPFLIILDLNMPRMGGLEFLTHLRSDPALKRSIVFILTTSIHENDRMACYDNGVAGLVLKQSLARQSDLLVQLLDEYWRLVELP